MVRTYVDKYVHTYICMYMYAHDYIDHVSFVGFKGLRTSHICTYVNTYTHIYCN